MARLALFSALLVAAASALQPLSRHQGHGATTPPQEGHGGWPLAATSRAATSRAANSRSRTRVVLQDRMSKWEEERNREMQEQQQRAKLPFPEQNLKDLRVLRMPLGKGVLMPGEEVTFTQFSPGQMSSLMTLAAEGMVTADQPLIVAIINGDAAAMPKPPSKEPLPTYEPEGRAERKVVMRYDEINSGRESGGSRDVATNAAWPYRDELVTGDEYRNREIKELNAPIRGISGTFQCTIARVIDQKMWLEAVNEGLMRPVTLQGIRRAVIRVVDSVEGNLVCTKNNYRIVNDIEHTYVPGAMSPVHFVSETHNEARRCAREHEATQEAIRLLDEAVMMGRVSSLAIVEETGGLDSDSMTNYEYQIAMQLLATCDGDICNMLFRPQEDDPKLNGPDWSVKFRDDSLETVTERALEGAKLWRHGELPNDEEEYYQMFSFAAWQAASYIAEPRQIELALMMTNTLDRLSAARQVLKSHRYRLESMLAILDKYVPLDEEEELENEQLST